APVNPAPAVPATRTVARLPSRHGGVLPRSMTRTRPLRIAAVIVTWSRYAAVDVVLQALARQVHGAHRLEIVIVDNGSTDGTIEHLSRTWRPDGVVDNPTRRAHEPAFSSLSAGGDGGHPFGSLTLVRNHHNLGGCGGFNTGLTYLDQRPDRAG